MLFTIERDDLIAGINVASRAVSPRSTMPILSCVLVKTVHNGITVTGNDLEMGIETTPIDAQVMEVGSIALDARLFGEIIKKMPDDYIVLSTDASHVCRIKCGKVKFTIHGLSGDEFPEPSPVKAVNTYRLSQTDIRSMIKGTVFGVSADESRPVLTGELFRFRNGVFSIAAVDGYRIAIRKQAVSDTSDAEMIIPAKSVIELSKILTEGEAVVSWCVHTHQL